MKVFRVGRRRRRVALVAGVAAAVLLALALPASAHSGSISGSTVCFNGEHIVTWHITNSSQSTDLLMTIVSVDASVGATPYAVTGYSSPLAKGASTDATSTVPGGVSGVISATLHVSWPDGITDTDTANVTLVDNCLPGTTTTTIPETTTTVEETTTTTIPETTTTVEETTTTVPETTTTVEETTTTIPDTTTSSTEVQGTTTLFTTTSVGTVTTTPITGLGSTTPVSGAATTAPGATTLPRTGSSSGYPVFFGLSCLAGGALLLIRRRSNWVR